MDSDELLRELDRLKATMISVATGGQKIGEVESSFIALYDVVDRGLTERGIDNPLPYRDLWEWYGRWSNGDMPKWAQRRTFVNEMFSGVVQQVRRTRLAQAATANSPRRDQEASAAEAKYDVFISHASEDKAAFVQPLAERLRSRGLRVWYDNFEFIVGDGLRRTIDKGLASSRYGIVVLSPAFFAKHWPQEELEGLAAREASGEKVILPVWHDISRSELIRHSPMLAGRFAAQSADGLDKVIEDLMRAIQRTPTDDPIGGVQRAKSVTQLIALGPEIVCTGDLVSIDRELWTVRIREFVVGDVGGLIKSGETFDTVPAHQRYVLLCALGDGRQLAAPISLSADGEGYMVRCPVAQSFPRLTAQELPSQWAASPDNNDIFVRDRKIARVSGVESLPQTLRQSLSHIRGESPFNLDYGSRLQEYYWRFRATPWLNAMLTLDVIRMAAIPYIAQASRKPHTPLFCVERIWSVTPLQDAPEAESFRMRLAVEVKGLGQGEYDVSVLMPSAGKTTELGKKGAAYAKSIGLSEGTARS